MSKSRIIAIAGAKQSGKSTLAERLRQAFWARGVGGRVAPLAAKLKDACEFSFGIPESMLYGTDPEKNAVTPFAGLTGRQFMQRFGQSMREIDPLFWVKVWKNFYGDSGGVLLVPDVRFPNEIEFFTNAGAFLVKLMRQPFPDDTDISERALASVPDNVFDLVVPADTSGDTTFEVTWAAVLRWLAPRPAGSPT